jgi:hypothetical protein
MKRALLVAILGLATQAPVCFGQGILYLDNYSSGPNYPQVTYGAGSGGAIGVGVNSNYKVGIYWAPGAVEVNSDPTGIADPASLGPLVLGTGVGAETQILFEGYFFSQLPFTMVPLASGPATVVVVAYNGASYASSTIRGHSAAFQIVPAQGAAIPPYMGNFMQPFSVYAVTSSPPAITQQPTNVSVSVGGNASFIVAATGSGPLSYHWYRGAAQFGTNSTLSLGNVQLADAGDYYAIVSNAYGAVTSSVATLSVLVGDSTPTNGLAAYYPFNGNANDASGNGKHGVNNGALMVADRFGNSSNAFAFDGTDYVSLDANRPVTGLQTNFTISAWFRANDTSGGDIYVHRAHFRDIGLYWSRGTPLKPGSVEWGIWDNSGQYHGIWSSALVTNEWIQCVGTYDGLTQKLYINGALVSSAPWSGTIDWNDAFIAEGIGGMSASGGGYLFNGAIDDVRVYTRALSTNEVAQLYVAEASNPPACNLPDGIVAWWKGEGDTTDSAGANDATAIGAVTFVDAKVGKGFRFDGAGSYLSVPHAPSLNLSNALSVEFWFKNEGPLTGVGLMAKRGTTLIPCNFGVNIISTGVGAYHNDPVVSNAGDDIGAYEACRAPQIPSTNEFHHLAATWNQVSSNEVQMQLFLDGQLLRSRTVAGSLARTLNGEIVTIAASAATAEYFKGIMDEVSLYGRALTANEITAIYQAGSAGKCPPQPPVCDLPDGIVSWWKAEQNGLDSVADNHGSLAGNATFDAGKVGQSFKFDGNGDAVQLGNPTSLQLQDFTIETWMKRGSSSVVTLDPAQTTTAFLGYGYGGYGFGMYDDGSLFLTRIGIDAVIIPSAITDTNWHHVAVAKNGSNVVFYVDGQTQPALTPYTSTFTFSTSIAIGARGDNLGNCFLGQLDEMTVYDRPLAGNEIAAIHAAGSGGKCPPATCNLPQGIAAWWKLEGNGVDSFGANVGTLVGSPEFKPGKVGQAIALDGSNDHLEAAASPSLNLGAGPGMTIETWIKPNSVGSQQPLVEWNNESGTIGAHFWISVATLEGGSGSLWINLMDTGGVAHQLSTTTGLVLPGVYQHVAASYDKASGAAAIYLNGSLVAQTNLGTFTADTTADCFLGYRPSGAAAGTRFAGEMDEVTLYGRALTASEIAMIYVADAVGKCPPAAMAPMITQQPLGQTVVVGDSASFAVGAVGSLPLTYQWFFGSSTPVPLATNFLGNVFNSSFEGMPPTYDISAGNTFLGWLVDTGNVDLVSGLSNQGFSGPSHSGTNALDISGNVPGAVSTDVATQPGKTYLLRLAYTKNPGGVAPTATVRVGGNTLLNLVADWPNTISELNWRLASALFVATSSTTKLELISGSGGNAGVFFDTIQVDEVEVISSSAPDAVAILGATNSTLLLQNVQLADAGSYFVMVSNQYGHVTSSNAFLEVQAFPPTLTAQPADTSVFVGKTAMFSAQASGTAPLHFQWQKGEVAVSNANSTSLTLANVQFADAGLYRLIVSNPFGSVTSRPASLTVNPPPVCISVPEGVVAWWPGESNLFDVVNGLDGISSRTMGYSTGYVGRAFVIGINGFSAPVAPELNLGTGPGFTFESWINPTSVTGTYSICGWGGSGLIGVPVAPFGVNLRIVSPGILEAQLVRTNGQTTILRTAAGALQLSEWQHVALSCDTSNGLMSIVLNGVSVAQTNIGSTALRTLGAFRVGTISATGFPGLLDEPTLYGRVLSQSEIAAIYLADEAGKCPLPPLPCLQPAPEMVAWWRGESNTVDSVFTNNLKIMPTNKPLSLSYGAGRVGAAFRLLGSDHLEAASAPMLDVGAAQGMTVEAWVFPDQFRAQPFIEWNSGTGTRGVGLGYGVTVAALEADLVDVAGVSHIIRSPTGLIGSGFWQHVAVAYDRSNGLATLYFNGVAVTATNLGVFTPRTTGNLYLGYRPPGTYAGSGSRFIGRMDEVAIYGRALTPEEIRAAYRNRAGRCTEAPLIVEQPASQVVAPGELVQFNPTVTGNPLLRYQWFKDGLALVGANSRQLSLPAVSASDEGVYQLVVSNNFGSATSSNAVLVINQPPLADTSATELLLISPNGSDAVAVLDGSRSSDPDGDVLAYEWFRAGESNAFATGVVVVTNLPMGSNGLTLVVEDGMASGSQNFVVEVITTSEAVDRLVQLAEDGDRPQPLLSSLRAALASIDRSQPEVAINQLEAFKNKVLAQVMPVDPELAAQLLADAQAIIDTLNGGPVAEVVTVEIMSITQGPNGKPKLNIRGNNKRTHVVEMSTNLVDWAPVGVASKCGDCDFEFEDGQGGVVGARYYRVVSPK